MCAADTQDTWQLAWEHGREKVQGGAHVRVHIYNRL
jgi:hypothetical protein